MYVRKSNERGHVEFGWLRSKHSFSFGHYMDPEHMGFGNIRVINEDWIDPASGFDTHPHRDMEILTFILSGEIRHKDSQGNEEVLRAGQVQKMSAGTGILHSEFNASNDKDLHLYQIWIKPAKKGIAPSYQTVDLPPKDRQDPWMIIASGNGPKDSTHTVHQNSADTTLPLAQRHGPYCCLPWVALSFRIRECWG